jgi:hypothetical protein
VNVRSRARGLLALLLFTDVGPADASTRLVGRSHLHVPQFWPHRGSAPRIIAQPAVHVRDGFVLDGSDPSPVARAIVTGLAMAEQA